MNWLVVAGVATAAYAVAVGFTLGWSRTWEFLTTTKELNAVGDFLAGIFAPVALIWLVAAVFTQRQELNDTRDQFAENQKVIDEQLKVINAQNELLALQHEQAVENARKAYKLSLFDKRFQIYEKFVAFDEVHDPNQPFANRDYDESSYWTMVKLSHEAKFVFDRAIADWLWAIAQQIDEYITFKTAHPLETGDDGYGHQIILNIAQNEGTRRLYEMRKDAIRDHFVPSERIGKFSHYLDVSDQPLVAG
ncbi:hypothetical protein [Ensifer aridi]|uniref:hypothetical protein n=1 Tax=Ensifer aridi TaxID=1708715 RepID=UPI00358E8480